MSERIFIPKKKQLHTLTQVIDFGKMKGLTVQTLIENHRQYYDWMLENEIVKVSKQVSHYANTPRNERNVPHFTAKVETLTGRQFEHKIFADSLRDAQKLADEMFDYSKLKTFELN